MRIIRAFTVGALAAALLVGCGDKGPGGSAGSGGTPTEPPPPDRPAGQSSFDSPLPGGGNNGRGTEGGDSAGGAGGATGTPPGAPGDGAGPQRMIEEGDIVKLDGTTLYVLNRYRGLQVIDLSDVTRPRLVSSAPFYGYPKELYVRGTKAYVIVSDYWSWWRCEECDGGFDTFRGSKVYVVDLADRTRPAIATSLNVEGEITDSRLVGDVLYVVSNEYSHYRYDGSPSTQDLTYVASINVAGEARQVARVDFPRNGWENHINVATDALFIASSAWGAWDGQGECQGDRQCTKLTKVDISDPAGQIAVRGSTVVAGYVQDRWQLDYDQANEVLRAVTVNFAWNSAEGPSVRTFRVRGDEFTPLGRTTVQLPRPESTMAVRFQAERAYIVTFEQRDPLFVVDLSDAAAPRVTASLDTPGWLDYIEPRGDRLVALGHDQEVDASGNPTSSWRLQVSLYDVADATAPALLDREIFGSDWGWTPGSRDDFQKVFKVLDDKGLILIPFTQYEEAQAGWYYGRSYGNVQLVDFDRQSLTMRGRVRQNGYTERAVPLPADKLAAVSNEVLDVLDISNRDTPRLDGSLELARNVADISIQGEVAVEYVGSFEQGNAQLYVVPASDPNTPDPLGRVDFDRPMSRIFKNGTLTYVVSSEMYTGRPLPGGNEPEILPGSITVVDIATPTSPRIRGRLELPRNISSGGCYYGGWEGGPGRGGVADAPGGWYGGCGAEMVQVDGTLLAMHQAGYCREWEPNTGRCTAQEPHRIHVADLGDPDAPVIASTTTFDEPDWMYGLQAQGRMLYISHYESFERDQQWYARYYLDRVDLADAARPAVRTKINIPGQFLGASADNRYIYAQEQWYEYSSTTGISDNRTLVHALEIDEAASLAYLRGTLTIRGYTGNVSLTPSGFAYTTVNHYDSMTGASRVELASLDLRDPANLRLATQDVTGAGQSYWWGSVTVAGARAFLMGGDGIAVYDISAAMAPRFDAFYRTHGYSSAVVVDGDRAYLPGGYYGVQVLDLR